MLQKKINIDWKEKLSENPIKVDDIILSEIIRNEDTSRFRIEKEYQNELLKYIDDIVYKLGFEKIHKIKQNFDIGYKKKRVKFDILITHIDGTMTIIECKYSKDKSPSERLINQARGIGQVLLYGKIFESIIGVKPRLFLSDEKIEELVLNMLKEQKIGFISLKDNRIFTMY